MKEECGKKQYMYFIFSAWVILALFFTLFSVIQSIKQKNFERTSILTTLNMWVVAIMYGAILMMD